MKRLYIPAIAIAALLLTSSTVDAQSCTCTLPPEGYLFCNHECKYPNQCKVPQVPRNEPFYCYYDTQARVCFDGGYDPCCDPLCGSGPF